MPEERSRAWVEINLNALGHNINDIRSKIPEKTEIMAIVKANAYGHGVKKTAEKLYEEGIKAFAVATLSEGIQLREYISDGEILVLGYTQPDNACFLHENRLSQLITDNEYAKALSNTGLSLHAHIAIDTGMHRLGTEPDDFEAVESIFKCENLIINGIATHLSSSDGSTPEDTEFTEMQLRKFYDLISELNSKGYNTGKIHAQSSYGIYNYSYIKSDYVRPGIMMYGVQSQNGDTKIKTDLQPVLSLKAIIAQVRWIKAGEHVSYGRSYTVEKPIKLATVSIGYADGIPRQMSGNNGQCIVKGKKVPIIGRICMDMLMLDVTGVEDVKPGDIVTLIGKNGDEEIRCEDMAEASGTITNDILTRLGSRLPRIYLND